MEHYDKNGKKQGGYFPHDQRKLWNCVGDDNIKSDVLGSYSGTAESDEEPVQDVDDL